MLPGTFSELTARDIADRRALILASITFGCPCRRCARPREGGAYREMRERRRVVAKAALTRPRARPSNKPSTHRESAQRPSRARRSSEGTLASLASTGDAFPPRTASGPP